YGVEDVSDWVKGGAPMSSNLVRGGASDGQIRYLVKLGIALPTAAGFNSRQAGAVIEERKGRSGGEYRVTFGKHAGKAVKELPDGYTDWVLSVEAGNPLMQELKPHVEAFLNQPQGTVGATDG